jgi:hypothetical protein
MSKRPLQHCTCYAFLSVRMLQHEGARYASLTQDGRFIWQLVGVLAT